MATARLEQLLQELIDQNAIIIDKLSDVLSELVEIKEELNWLGEHSLAKRIVDQLDEVESAIREIGS
jgi:hypothetical protein